MRSSIFHHEEGTNPNAFPPLRFNMKHIRRCGRREDSHAGMGTEDSASAHQWLCERNGRGRGRQALKWRQSRNERGRTFYLWW